MGILLAEAALKDGSARNAGGVVGRERRLHEAMGGHDDLFLIIHRHKRRERTEEIGLTRQRDGGGFVILGRQADEPLLAPAEAGRGFRNGGQLNVERHGPIAMVAGHHRHGVRLQR